MGTTFWVVRAGKVFTGIYLVLLVVELLKGSTLAQALLFALSWSVISTSIFISSRLYYTRKGQPCALCNDTSETNNKTP